MQNRLNNNNKNVKGGEKGRTEVQYNVIKYHEGADG